MYGLSSKTGKKQGAHTLHQPYGVAITLFLSPTTLLVSKQTNLERRERVVFS